MSGATERFERAAISLFLRVLLFLPQETQDVAISGGGYGTTIVKTSAALSGEFRVAKFIYFFRGFCGYKM